MGVKDNDGLDDGPGVSPYGIGFNLEGVGVLGAPVNTDGDCDGR